VPRSRSSRPRAGVGSGRTNTSEIAERAPPGGPEEKPKRYGSTVLFVDEVPPNPSLLSETQERDILYNNAARFLRLSEAEIARHHGRSAGNE
jgi:hypothetical protein